MRVELRYGPDGLLTGISGVSGAATEVSWQPLGDATKAVEVTLPAAVWLEAARKDPAFAAQGALLPMAATCEIAYADKQGGSVELLEATLRIYQQSAAVAPGAPGFWLGLWHGFIFPIAWIISLFTDHVAVYAVPNSGGWYNFGYFLGIVVLGVGARKSRIVYRERVVRVRD